MTGAKRWLNSPDAIEVPLDYDPTEDCAAAGHPPIQSAEQTTICPCGHRFYARTLYAGPIGRYEDEAVMKDINNLEAGDILMIEAGQYSDFYYMGPFRVVKAMKRADVSARFVAEFTPDPTRPLHRRPNPSDFTAWLAREGYIEDIPSAAWHAGDYGDFDPGTSGSQQSRQI